MSPHTHSISRRHLAAGAAWTVPAIAVAAMAPNVSASLQPGLQGWVILTKTCRSGDAGRSMTIDVNGFGSYPSRGLWVYNTTSTTTIAAAKITFYFPSALQLSFSTATNHSPSWSSLAADSSAPAIQGMTAYSASYTGSFAFVPAGNGQPAYSYAVGQPHYQATASVPPSSNYCESDKLPVTARRTVTVDGQVITFSRSVNL